MMIISDISIDYREDDLIYQQLNPQGANMKLLILLAIMLTTACTGNNSAQTAKNIQFAEDVRLAKAVHVSIVKIQELSDTDKKELSRLLTLDTNLANNLSQIK
jgi:hypothetical protein